MQSFCQATLPHGIISSKEMVMPSSFAIRYHFDNKMLANLLDLIAKKKEGSVVQRFSAVLITSHNYGEQDIFISVSGDGIEHRQQWIHAFHQSISANGIQQSQLKLKPFPR